MSPTATADRSGRCTFLGAGPGDPGLLTLRAVEVLASADILIADPLTAAAVRTHCPEGVQLRTPAGPDADAAAADIGGWGDAASLAKLVAEAVQAGKHVVRTVDGDPGLDGRAAEEMLLCAKAGLAFEVIPGVAQSVGVPAYAGVPLRGSNGADVRFVDGQALVAGALVDLGAPETTLVVRTTLGQLPATAASLVTHGRKPDAALCATLSGTTTRQRTFTATLSTIAAELKAARVLPSPVSAPVDPATSVIAVVGEQVAHRSSHSWFETKPLFGWNVLVPRTKEQATGLSEQLRSYGAVPQEVPTIAVEPPRTPQQMERAIKGLVTGRYEWIAFTSVNAVRAVREKFEEYGLDARAFAGIKVAAVGETTAQALVDFGVKPDLVPVRRAVRGRPAGGLAAVRPGLRPDRPGPPAARRHRHRDPGGRPGRARLGGGRRHGLPHRARLAAAGRDPRGDQGRRLRRGALHLVLDRAQPGRHRRQAAQRHHHRLHRSGHRQDRRGARPAGGRDGPRAVRLRAGPGPGGLRRRTPGHRHLGR